jgi:hypothetical protein
MSTLLEPETNQVSDSDSLSNSVNQVRGDFAACRVKFRWFGTTKTLSTAQKSQAAESFGAQGKAISAAKRLIDTKNDRYRVSTSIKSNIVRYWRDSSLAFPEPGIRLIRQDRIDAFDLQLARYQQELQTAVGSLDEHFNELKEAARVRLGSLFNLSDYPASLAEEFAVVWDFPNVEAPDYLRRLNPEVYRQQAELVSQRFAETVAMAEQAFIDELDQLVAHLAERLSGDDDGKPKIFRDTSLTNLTAFFRRFNDLNVSSNDQLDDLVERCQQLVSGVAPQSLRDNDSLRTSLANNLSSVQSALDQLMVERPRRNIIRPSRQSRSEG